MLLFFAGGSRKKSYEVSKFGGGGGGGVYALNEFFEKIHNIYEFFFFCNIADNIIQFVVSIGFLCVRRYGLSELSAQ